MPAEGKFTEAECRAAGGEIITRDLKGGRQIKLCKIDVSKHPEYKLPWQEKGHRVITLGLK